jgi:hypothetical protein
MKKVLYLLAAAALLFAFAGCSDDDDPASATVVGASGNAVSLDGTWDEGCEQQGTQGSSSGTLVFAGSAFTGTFTDYQLSTTCETASAETSGTASGSFTLGNTVADTPLGATTVTATEMDATFTGATFTLHTAAGVADANANSACGFSDWVVDTAKQIFGTECWPAEDNTFLDLIYVDDSVTPNLMYGGDDTGIDTSTTRPTSLDATAPATRL